MPQFVKRRTQPTRPDSYLRMARLLRQWADRIEACAEQRDPIEKSSVTRLLYRAHVSTRAWLDRHHATVTGSTRD